MADSGPQAERGRGHDPFPLLERLTAAQHQLLQGWCEELQAAPGWRSDLPVALLERCWLRLRAVPVAALAEAVPVDSSAEAPELVRWRQLVQHGSDPWSAQLVCWQEFGAQACQQAQRRHWRQRERRACGWSLSEYLTLLRDYRRGLSVGDGRRLPLLVLRRPDGEERHSLHWVPCRHRTMRHTCA